MTKNNEKEGVRMKWTVGKKLSMIFIILMVVIIIISMVGIISTYTLNKNTKETDDTIIPKLQTIQGLAQKTEKIHGAIQSHILSKDEEFELKYEEEINDLKDEIDEDLNKYNDFAATQTEQTALEDIENKWISYKEQTDGIIEDSAADKDKEAASKNYDAVILLNDMEDQVIVLNQEVEKDVTASTKDGSKIFRNVLIGLIVSSGIGVLISIAFILYLRRTLQRPIVHLSDKFKDLATGDLTISPVDVQTNDEIGELGHNFNQMLEQLYKLVQSLHEHIGVVTITSNKLMSSAEETNEVAGQIAESVYGVSEDASQQMERAKTGYQAIDEIATSIDQTSTGMNHVTSLSIESTDKTETGRELMNETTDKMAEIEQSTNQTFTVVESLSTKSEEISEITSMITSISDQTNLLALNAAIEAARAGEQGKGFAVVADEVRKLAEQSGNAAQHITSLITAIQEEIKGAITAMNTSRSFVKEGMEMVEKSGNRFGDISDLVNQVSNEVEGISTITVEINSNTQSVKTLMDGVVQMSENTDERSQTVAAAVEEQSATMQEMSNASIRLHEMSTELNDLIAYFKI